MPVSGKTDSKEYNRDQQKTSERGAWEIKGATEFKAKPVEVKTIAYAYVTPVS